MEYLNAFDRDGKPVGKVERQEAHSENAGVFHKAVWIWFLNSKGEVLVQQRSKFKRQGPLKWDFPSAGHVDCGEDLLTTCVRETKEELGIKLPKNRFEFLFETCKEKGWEFGETYLVLADISISEMKLQPEEVADAKWLPFEEFKELFYSPDFCNHAIEYKDKICEIFSERIESQNQS